jgi:hypothetical protein
MEKILDLFDVRKVTETKKYAKTGFCSAELKPK